MNIEDIREFYVLSVTNSFSETAEQLFTTQSSISKHLKRQEDEIGTPLFTRTSRKVKLNEAGKVFFTYAEKFLSLQDELVQAMSEHVSPSLSTLNIAVFSSMSLYEIPELITAFHQEYPFVSTRLIEARVDNMISMLMDGTCNVAFFREGSSIPLDSIEKIPFYTDKVTAVMAKGHPYEAFDTIPLKKLAEAPILAAGTNNNLYKSIVTALKKTGKQPNFIYLGHSYDNILGLAKQGAGIALTINQSAKALPADTFSIRPLSPEITSNIYVLYRKDQKLSPQVKNFIRFVKNIN